MSFVGFLIVGFGVYLVDSAIKNRGPLRTLTDLIQTGKLSETLTANTGKGFIPTALIPTGREGSGLLPATLVPTGREGSALSGNTAAAVTAVQFAQTQLGKPYLWGGTGPDRWDCSGLIQAAYRLAGIKLPRTSYLMLSSGKQVSKEALQLGDIVWPKLGHIQLYLGNGQMLEAPYTGQVVRVVPMRSTFYTARRVV